MPRPGRIFAEGAIYHVYNRLARGEQVFAAEGEAVKRARHAIPDREPAPCTLSFPERWWIHFLATNEAIPGVLAPTGTAAAAE